ncbi:hypothetical protein PR048_031718 [Dryococelus australis]|uniref:Uncharacterized protein n=1 Tax=Dryococelus australis TaxID=614101 RepID=A0ABQ9G625_9NEOP|nr:hypothetical protein PR048_031718 [Dryococelus australis]
MHVPVYDWRSPVSDTGKNPGNWHFRFPTSKRILISKTGKGVTKVQGEISYNVDVGVAISIFKRENSWFQTPPTAMAKGVTVEA